MSNNHGPVKILNASPLPIQTKLRATRVFNYQFPFPLLPPRILSIYNQRAYMFYNKAFWTHDFSCLFFFPFSPFPFNLHESEHHHILSYPYHISGNSLHPDLSYHLLCSTPITNCLTQSSSNPSLTPTLTFSPHVLILPHSPSPPA